VRRNLKALIIDEADRILEIGFEQQMRDIIAMLPKGSFIERIKIYPNLSFRTPNDPLLRNPNHKSN